MQQLAKRTIKLTQAQWTAIGKTAGWLEKEAQTVTVDVMPEVCPKCGARPIIRPANRTNMGVCRSCGVMFQARQQ